MATVRKKPLYQIISGVRLAAVFSPICFKEALAYKPQPNDNFVISYPKSGTFWMQNVVFYILRKGKPLNDYGQFLVQSPFLDMLGEEGIRKMQRPGAIKTHLPFNCMPYSKEAKYIFVARNPRDVCVSFFYHTKMIPGLLYQDGVFDHFFELFMNGEVEYGDYFDHLLSWYPHRKDKNIYYTTYEKMKKEPEVVIYQLAKFLGQEYVEAIEKDNAVMSNILKFTSFQHMKDIENKKPDGKLDRESLLADPVILEGWKHILRCTVDLNLPNELPKLEMVRKGIVGDWKSHFSQEQLNRLNIKTAEKFKGTDLDTWWTY